METAKTLFRPKLSSRGFKATLIPVLVQFELVMIPPDQRAVGVDFDHFGLLRIDLREKDGNIGFHTVR